MTEKERRCPHGIRWPHECRDCFDSMPKAHEFEDAEAYQRALDQWEKQHAYK